MGCVAPQVRSLPFPDSKTMGSLNNEGLEEQVVLLRKDGEPARPRTRQIRQG